jgi:hypothetical protein
MSFLETIDRRFKAIRLSRLITPTLEVDLIKAKEDAVGVEVGEGEEVKANQEETATAREVDLSRKDGETSSAQEAMTRR